MYRSRFSSLFGAAGLAFVPALANAHPGHGTAGLIDGVLHPLTGFDHALVMLAVGLWASRPDVRRAWQLPLVFLVLLAAGAVAARAGGATAVPGALEQAIAASVVVSGVLLALARRAPAVLGYALFGTFAVLHGFAHGAEAPADFAAYGAGFVAGSAALHIMGLGVGLLAHRQHSPVALRLGGGAMALCGVAMLAG